MTLRLSLGIAALLSALSLPATATPRVAQSAPVLAAPLEAVRAAIQAALDQPRQYAVDAVADAGLEDGAWTAVDGGQLWHLRLYSAGASSLAAQLDGIALPAEAELRWRDPQGGAVHRYHDPGDGRWWTPALIGEWGLLELWLPAHATSLPLHLRLRRLFHGIPDRSGLEVAESKASGSCNVDTACSAAEPWRDPVRSTVRLTIDNRFLCSGALIDNSRRDDRPLLISARHCGITPDTARSVVALFNFERSDCSSQATALSGERIEGSLFIGESDAADTTLVELMQRPPERLGVRYSGWNAEPPESAGAPKQGAGVHHPSGDVKKISLFEGEARRDDGVRIGRTDGEVFRVDSWSVIWASGTTEAGSSGSGLWNQDRELVGVLSGGTASCDNPRGRDYYGRLDRALGTSPDIAMALDPVQDGQLRRLPSRAEPAVTRGLPMVENGAGGSGIWLWMAFFWAGQRFRRMII